MADQISFDSFVMCVAEYDSRVQQPRVVKVHVLGFEYLLEKSKASPKLDPGTSVEARDVIEMEKQVTQSDCCIPPLLVSSCCVGRDTRSMIQSVFEKGQVHKRVEGRACVVRVCGLLWMCGPVKSDISHTEVLLKKS